MRAIIAFLGVLIMSFSASAQSVGTYTHRLGDFKIVSLITRPMEHSPSLFRSLNPDILPQAMNEANFNQSSSNVFLVDVWTRKVLFDSGMDGKTLELLREAGYKPEDIDIICLTHMHSDHIGGLLGNDGKPAFPNAVIYVSKHELNANYDNQAIRAYKNRVKPFSGRIEIAPGINSVPAEAHTPGHMLYLVQSQDQKLIIWGDLLHALVQFKYPEVYLTYDADPSKAVMFRKEILEEAAARHWLIAGMHVIYPGMGYVVKEENGYRFEPLE